MKLKVSKKQIVLCVAIVIVAALIATILLVGNPANLIRDKVVSSDTYTDDVNYGDVSSVFQDQIESYLASYLEQADSLGYVTEDDMTAVTAEITSGVLNSIPESEINEKNWKEIRQFVSNAVATEMTAYNLSSTNDTTQQFELTDEFRNYITNQIVPAITAEYQIYNNDVEDLRNSLTRISNEYAANKAAYDALITNIQNKLSSLNVDITRVSDVASNTSTVDNLEQKTNDLDSKINNTAQDLNTKIDENTRDLDSSIKNLSNVLNDYKSETSTSFTTVNNEIKNLSADITDIVAQLTQITEDQVKEVKTSLTAQIEANTDLLDSQKKEYSDLINSLEASTTTELTKKVTELQNSITSSANSNADALNSAIDNLYGDADGNITISDLLSQISASNDYTNDQKNQLTELINNKYGDLQSSTNYAISDIKSDLADEIQNRKNYTDTAVNNLRTTLAGQIANLTTDLSSTKASVQSSLDDINGQLNGCSIEYKDGHFYITYHKGGADSVSKKLDYVP